VLDKTDLASADPALIFRDSTLANLSLNYIYDQNLPTWGGITMISSIGGSSFTDESYGESKYLEGTLTTADVTDFGTALSPSNSYGKIDSGRCQKPVAGPGILLPRMALFRVGKTVWWCTTRTDATERRWCGSP
jgi:hypothetical protein